MSRRSTARGFSTGLVTAGPTKTKAQRSVLFTKGTPKVEIKNTCLIQLTDFILSHFAPMLYAIAKCSHSIQYSTTFNINQVFFILYDIGTIANKTELTRPHRGGITR